MSGAARILPVGLNHNQERSSMPVRAAVASTGESASNDFTVQDAITETVHRTAGFHPKRIAGVLNRSHRYVLDIADDLRGARLKAEEVPALVNGTGNLLVLETIARQCGCVVYQLPPAVASNGSTLRTGASVISECADVVRSFADCADGQVTSADLAALEREGEQAIAAILAAMAFARAQRSTK